MATEATVGGRLSNTVKRNYSSYHFFKLAVFLRLHAVQQRPRKATTICATQRCYIWKIMDYLTAKFAREDKKMFL